MKLNIIKYAVVATLSVSLLASCEDYLTESNPNYTNVENFWEDLDDTQTGLNAAYAVLRTADIVATREEAWRSDMGWPGFGRPVPTDNATGWSWYAHLYTNSTSMISDKWDALYTGVWRANQVIDALKELESTYLSDEDDYATWTYQMAQARFLRGVYYFYLHSAFNEGSVVLKKSATTIDNLYEGLSSSDEVLAFFRDDLQYAYDNLPYVNPTGDAYTGLPAKGAAATLLGTSHLYEHEYSYANKYFEELVTDSQYPYELETDLDKMFTMAGEFNSESILEINYTTDERTDISTWSDNVMTNALGTFSTSTGGFLAPAWMVVAYSELDDMDDKFVSNYYIDPVTTDVTLRPVSRRASSMITLLEDDITPYYIDGNAIQNGKFGATGWGFGMYKKYTNHDIFTQEVASTSGKNVILNRLSDVYLMYAECQLELYGDAGVTKALEYINYVRARWGLVLLGKEASGTYAGERTYNDLDYTYETLTTHLRDVERPLELSTEGHQIRWQDLRRWGYLEDDSNNIFTKRSKESYTACRPDGFSIYSFTDLDGEAITTGYIAAITMVRSAEFLAEYPNTRTGNMSTVDYEYDNAALNYRSSRNKFYPIPLSEVMNNPAIKD